MQVLADPGFETPAVGIGNFLYDPVTSPWTFSGSAGLTGNSSGFTAGNPAAPEGSQVAFLQGVGSLSQSNTFPAGTYNISLSAAQRGNGPASSQTFQVLVDGSAVGTFNNLTGAAYTVLTTASFAVAAGSHTVTFRATDLHGGDNTVLIDQASANLLPSLNDPGFETPAIGTGTFLYDPGTSPWTFVGSAGLTGNSSGFTAGNPAAPQGWQVAFLQGLGSLSQETVLPAGAYTVSFSAAQRARSQASSQTFQVLVDGNVVGTFNNLAGSGYTLLTTATFPLATGSHTITFKATDLHGGDNTVLIDQANVILLAGLNDPGFETPAVGAGTFLYNPTMSPWTFTGWAGLTGNNSGFTSGNPAAPQGNQVAFLQGLGSVSQATTLRSGTYTVSVSAAQRGNGPASNQTFQVLVDGNVVGTFNILTGTAYTTLTTGNFTVPAGGHTLTFQATDLRGGDNTVLIDQVSINLFAGFNDPGFETPAAGIGKILYDPAASPWTFAGSAGVAANNSAFTAGNPAAPQGSQVAFLQGFSSVSQSATLPAGTYLVILRAAQRGNFQASSQTFQVQIDGSTVGTFYNLTGTAYTVLTTNQFTVNAGSHYLTIWASDLHGGDNTVFIDQVSIYLVASLNDPGFESPAAGSAKFLYDPGASPWTFNGLAGVTGNYSAFTAANPPAPQGNQVAFLQGQGSLSQAVNLPAGTYAVSFSAAQRGVYQTCAQTFQVLIDGNAIASFNNLTGTAYTALSTGSFTVAAGTHTLTFQGTNLRGGDNTVFIDPVSLIGKPGSTLPPPTATFTNSGSVNMGNPATVSFIGSAGGSGGYSYSFDFNDTGSFDIAHSTAAQATVPGADLATSGLHMVHGRITDSTGTFTDYSTGVMVNGLSPPPPPPPPPPGALAVSITGSPGYTPLGTPITLASTVNNGVGPFAYAWSITFNGIPLAGAGTGSSFSFTPAADGTYVATVVAAGSDSKLVTGSATVIVTDASDPLYRPVLNQNDFTYVGSFLLPHSANGWDTAYSTGGLTFRYDKGQLDFLTTSHTYSGGLVYEVGYPGISTTAPFPTASVAYNWGDVYSGQKWVGNDGGTAGLSSGVLTYGLYYDQTLGRLYWNYGNWYNVTNPYNPSMGYSLLNDATGVASGIGAWSLSNRFEKFDRGGTLRIPQWFADRFTGGASLGVGFGGAFSIISTASFGPALAAVSDPNLSTNPDDSALPNVPLLGYPSGAPDRGHRDPNYTSFYDVGSTYPTTPGAWNPSGGTGYWTWSDLIYGAGTWIDLPGGKQGVLFLAKVGQGNVWYEHSDIHSQSGAFEWLVYNPADLAAVASGLKQQWQIQPQYEWTSSTLPLPALDASGWSGNGASQVGGITFDPSTNRLYVLVNSAAGWNGSESWPEIYVYQVGPAIAAVTPAAGTTGVSIGTPLTITFLTAMDFKTFTAGAIVVQDSAGNDISTIVTYNPATNTALVTPILPLVPTKTYTVVIAGGGSSTELKDLFGDPLSATYSWSFTTGL